MRPDPKLSFFIGLAALALFVAVGLGYAIDPRLFTTRVGWIARFAQTASLDEGAPVYDHGMAVGRVVNLAWDRAAQNYRVVLAMDRDWQPPDDGGVRVAEFNPLRGPIVQVVEGATCENRKTTTEARGLPVCDRSPGMIEVAHDILARVAEVTAQVQALAGRVGAASGAGGAASPSPFAAVADNVGALTLSARTLVDRLVALEPELRQTLVSAGRTSSAADATLHHADALIDGLQRDTLMRANRTLDGTDRLVRAISPSIQATTGDLQYVLGASSASVVRLIADMRIAAANLAELSRQLRESPGVLLHGRTLQDPPGTDHAR